MAKKIAIVSGVFLVLLGVLGFFPNPLAGMDGFFKANQIYNVSRIAFGLILLGVASLEPRVASTWLKVLGIVYILRAVLGFLVVPYGGELFGGLATNAADHLLHFVLGIVLLAAGYLEKKQKPLSP
jgi:hypothetical protein